MSNAITRGIRIQVTSHYLPERSSPSDEHFFFTYHVTISNEGDERAKLVSREVGKPEAEALLDVAPSSSRAAEAVSRRCTRAVMLCQPRARTGS